MERKDHFSPQVYLRGFIDPAKANDEKPLSVFVLARTRWEKKSPSQIGWRRGFESMTDPDLEQQVQEIVQDSENRWNTIVRGIRATTYSGWPRFLPFLLEFAAWLSIRNPLCRMQIFGDLQSDNSENLLDRSQQDAALHRMVSEFPGRLTLLSSLSWTLRYSTNPAAPIVTCDHAVVLDDLNAERRNVDIAFGSPDAVVVFPVAWDILLLGRRGRWESPCCEIAKVEFDRLYGVMRNSATEFVVSPHEVNLPNA